MPRAIRSAPLETRTARLKLPVRKKPYGFTSLAKGIGLGYRRNAGPGVWVVRAADGKGGSWTKGFAAADDHEDSDGAKVLTYFEAQDRARKLARGQDADAGRPVTVDEAINDYAADLAARGADPRNATRLRKHLPPRLLSKPVSLWWPRELTHWRNGLRGERHARSERSTATPAC